jgi:hypothetical protein
VGGPSRIAGGDEADPCLFELVGERDGLGVGLVADGPSGDGAVQRAERQGDVEAVAGIQGAAEGPRDRRSTDTARDVQKLGGSTRRGQAREHTEGIPRVTTVASRPDTLIREKTVVRYLRKTAFIAGAGLALSLLGSVPASADNWDSSAPTDAVNVTTRLQANTDLGTLQLRKGKLGSNWYIWARISKPTSTANKSYKLFFIVGSSPVSVDINGTSYTKGYKLISGKTYKGCLKKDTGMPGGSYYKCISFTQ